MSSFYRLDGKEEKGKRDDDELELPGIVGLEGITGDERATGEPVGEALLKPGEPGTPRLVMGTVP
ncbi:hypothetical protein EYF80_037350 [Liparis tanakae]|uniref:Uncharacterized protein n=1 Tax=Liparis tanakae TaxID=230148 RepID=A0A4Z2GGM9_9TELE|nr:hypothetical protein EYF80_037350 [Liparis tanakae]